MSGIPENEGANDRWLIPLITVASGMLCTSIGWTSLLLLHFPSIRAVGGLVLAGFAGYGLFSGLMKLSNRYLVPAAVGTVATIIAVVTLWPVACAEQGGKLGAPIKHYCTCAGLTVRSWQHHVSHPTTTTYCLGWETKDVWEERTDMNILN